VRGAMNRDRGLIHHAVELDPTVIDKAAGIRAIDACMASHADLIGGLVRLTGANKEKERPVMLSITGRSSNQFTSASWTTEREGALRH
jgi:hypothetical protein